MGGRPPPPAGVNPQGSRLRGPGRLVEFPAADIQTPAIVKYARLTKRPFEC
jgi:hypothetical protein